MHRYFIIILLLLNAFNSIAQTPRSLKISYANDLFTGTDQYFTQGIRIEWMDPRFHRSPINRLSLLPAYNPKYSIAIQQDGFTPTSIRHDSILKGDRPFCGSIFLTNSMYSLSASGKTSCHTELMLGAIGPLAMGFEEQTAIHKAIGDVLPKGWRNEIQNDLILNYNMELQQTLLNRPIINLSGISQIRLGTMFTDISAGAVLRLGLRNTPDQTRRKWQFFALTKARLKAVGYNATLQGGLLNRSSVYTIAPGNIQRLLAETEFGLTLCYKEIMVTYSQNYLSNEFNTGLPHAWGRITLAMGL